MNTPKKRKYHRYMKIGMTEQSWRDLHALAEATNQYPRHLASLLIEETAAGYMEDVRAQEEETKDDDYSMSQMDETGGAE